jgi:hypothetical protein
VIANAHMRCAQRCSLLASHNNQSLSLTHRDTQLRSLGTHMAKVFGVALVAVLALALAEPVG